MFAHWFSLILEVDSICCVDILFSVRAISMKGVYISWSGSPLYACFSHMHPLNCLASLPLSLSISFLCMFCASIYYEISRPLKRPFISKPEEVRSYRRN